MDIRGVCVRDRAAVMSARVDATTRILHNITNMDVEHDILGADAAKASSETTLPPRERAPPGGDAAKRAGDDFNPNVRFCVFLFRFWKSMEVAGFGDCMYFFADEEILVLLGRFVGLWIGNV